MMKIKSIFICIFFTTFFSVNGEEITLSSATSLKAVVEKIVEEYKKNELKDGKEVEINVNYGSSGTLRKQIENGAEVDIVMFADSLNLEKLEKQGLIEEKIRGYRVFNTLVFVGNKPLEKNGIIGLCEPKVVPLGSYSMESLKHKKYKKIYDDLSENSVIVRDYREVINAIENENIDYGILYKTEVKNLKNSHILFEIDDDTHSKIEYSFGVVKKENEEKLKVKNSNDVKRFYKFLNSENSERIFLEFGFKTEKI